MPRLFRAAILIAALLAFAFFFRWRDPWFPGAPERTDTAAIGVPFEPNVRVELQFPKFRLRYLGIEGLSLAEELGKFIAAQERISGGRYLRAQSQRFLLTEGTETRVVSLWVRSWDKIRLQAAGQALVLEHVAPPSTQLQVVELGSQDER